MNINAFLILDGDNRVIGLNEKNINEFNDRISAVYNALDNLKTENAKLLQENSRISSEIVEIKNKGVVFVEKESWLKSEHHRHLCRCKECKTQMGKYKVKWSK